MTDPLERLIYLDRNAAKLFDLLKSRRNLKTDRQALQYCLSEAAFSLAEPEDLADEDDPSAEKVFNHAVEHPETLTSLDNAFALLRRELEEEHPGTYADLRPVRVVA